MRVQDIKKILAVLFMLGFFIGIIYANLFAKTYISSMGIFSDYFLSQYSEAKIKPDEYIWHIIRVRALPIILIGFLGYTNLKKATGSICLLWTGFSCGLIFTAAVMKKGMKGIVLCLIGMVPQFICYITAYVMILFYLFEYPNVRWNSSKTVSLILFMLLGMISECYVNPMLMDIFLKTI